MNNRTLKVRKGHWDSIPKRTPAGIAWRRSFF